MVCSLAIAGAVAADRLFPAETFAGGALVGRECRRREQGVDDGELRDPAGHGLGAEPHVHHFLDASPGLRPVRQESGTGRILDLRRKGRPLAGRMEKGNIQRQFENIQESPAEYSLGRVQ